MTGGLIVQSVSLHHIHPLIGGARHKREILKPHYREENNTKFNTHHNTPPSYTHAGC